MKRATLLIVALLIAASVFGQSLLQNSYYQKSLELRAQAAEAFDAGDYDAAADLAAQAQEFARLSDEFVETMLAKNQADQAYAAAQVRMTWAVTNNVPDTYPSEWSLATARMSLATAAYESESWLDAAEYSDQVLEALADVTERLPLPRYYAVRLIPERRDCLWRIAEYPFVYGDPWKWRLLYDANKKVLVNPNDPDLILPGQILEIPSIRGETRSGTWDPTKPYVELPKP